MALGLACTAPAAAQEVVTQAGEPSQAVEPSQAETASQLPPDKRAIELALDGSYAAGGQYDLDYGGGGALRLGYAFPFRWAALVPEVGADVFAISGVDSATVFGGFVGGRARFGRGVEPGIHAHVGVAGVRWRDDYVAPTVDVGLHLELTYFPRLIAGVQGEYKSTIAAGSNASLSWYTAGITIGTRFF